MKKISAIILFFCFNALLFFLTVHKHSQHVKLSYEIQKLQTSLQELLRIKSEAIYTQSFNQQPTVIQETAEKKLLMKPIELKSVKSINETHE